MLDSGGAGGRSLRAGAAPRACAGRPSPAARAAAAPAAAALLSTRPAPGAPGVIIGYNDDCAFGFTNGGRDVRDYYEIKFKDNTRQEYSFNGQWMKTKFRIDTIKIKSKPDFIDSVAYVRLGNDWCPVMYDKTFSGGRNTNNKYYAVRWKAHDASNELKIFNMLNMQNIMQIILQRLPTCTHRDRTVCLPVRMEI